MSQNNKLFFFVDDSGSKDWDTPYSKEFVSTPPKRDDDNVKFWRGNYFVLSGIHISSDSLSKIDKEINLKKIEYFGTKHVEIKSDWLRNPHQRRKKYLEPYGISEEKLREFIDEVWYPVLSKNTNDIQVQSFVLDKRYYNSKRADITPLQILVQVLFDRVELHPNSCCEIVFDQMDSDIQSKKHQQGSILEVSKNKISLKSFSEKYSHSNIRFEKSSNSNFLQIADTVAYNIHRQFVFHGDSWESIEEKKLEMYPYLARIIGNFYNQRGRVSGFGIVKVPDPSKKIWGIFNKKTP